MKVLIIGSGGREHALTWKIKQSERVSEIFVAPGNGGTASIAQNVDIKADDIDGLLKFAKDNAIDLTIVGPEAPLVAGIVDRFQKAKLKIFGPSKDAAQLEGSKAFSKDFMRRWAIPTADFEIFSDIKDAKEYLEEASFPLVVKADGLAAGKGVIICHNKEEATQALTQIMTDKIFADAGKKVIIEECLQGPEASMFIISDGRRFLLLETSQDHKRIFDEDKGPNTGGMGAYSPAPIVTSHISQQVIRDIIKPTIEGMNNEGTPFKGILYVGLMLTKDGPKTLEYNVRFGDPEAQAIIPRMNNDLFEVLWAAVNEELEFIELDVDPRPCVSVVMASGGYPGTYEKGFDVKGIDQVSGDNVFIFQAGTTIKGNKTITSGGRVLAVSAFGASIADAVDAAYKNVAKISFDHSFYRRDIAHKALATAKK